MGVSTWNSRLFVIHANPSKLGIWVSAFLLWFFDIISSFFIFVSKVSYSRIKYILLLAQSGDPIVFHGPGLPPSADRCPIEPPSSLDRRSTELIVSPEKVVGCRGGSRYFEGCWDSLTWKYKSWQLSISWFLIDMKFISKSLYILFNQSSSFPGPHLHTFL